MNLCSLRALARELRVWGYASENREQLTTRLLTRIKRRTRRGNAL